jgi:hypothetical protein
MVEALASGAPVVVLFLHDLQWADAATLEVLDYAGRRWAEQGASVLVLLAARPEEPGLSSTFERWLSSLGRRLPVAYPTKYKRLRAAFPRSALRRVHATFGTNQGLARRHRIAPRFSRNPPAR